MANEQKMNSRRFAIKYGFLILLAGLVIFFSISAEGFAGPRSAVFIFQSVSITGILALGVTATLVVDGFDLSIGSCLLYTSPSPRDGLLSRMPSSA